VLARYTLWPCVRYT